MPGDGSDAKNLGYGALKVLHAVRHEPNNLGEPAAVIHACHLVSEIDPIYALAIYMRTLGCPGHDMLAAAAKYGLASGEDSGVPTLECLPVLEL